MNPIDDESLSAVGADLLSHAQEFGAPNRLPLTTQLFPFLLLASRRMTTREMSEWLAREKGVKLSAVMITKGLKRPDLHLRRIAEHVQPLACFIATLFSQDAEDLLFGEDPRSGITSFRELEASWWEASDHLSDAAKEALYAFSESWDQIPQEVKFMCRRYFEFGDESEDDDSEDFDDSDDPTSPQETEP